MPRATCPTITPTCSESLLDLANAQMSLTASGGNYNERWLGSLGYHPPAAAEHLADSGRPPPSLVPKLEMSISGDNLKFLLIYCKRAHQNLDNSPESLFVSCVSALDRVTRAYRIALPFGTFPGTYEADAAAFCLMEVVWQQVNAVSAVAELQPHGSHYEPACVLCRVAYEASVTAVWLTGPSDWKDRESRWLRWFRKEEDYLRRLSRDVGTASQDAASSYDVRREELESFRQQVATLLRAEYITAGIPEREAKARCSFGSTPTFKSILLEAGLGPRDYALYSTLSHSTHVGPSAATGVLRVEGNRVTPYLAHGPHEWPFLFRIAAWSVTWPAQRVLALCDAPVEKSHQVVDAHSDLLAACARLEAAYKLS